MRGHGSVFDLWQRMNFAPQSFRTHNVQVRAFSVLVSSDSHEDGSSMSLSGEQSPFRQKVTVGQHQVRRTFPGESVVLEGWPKIVLFAPEP